MTRRLSVAHLTALDLAPPDFIEAAADAGFDGVGLRLLRVTGDSPGYPLMQDRAMLRATKAAMRATGLAVFDIEFARITPETEPAALGPLLETGAELGARHLITAPYDTDHRRLADKLAQVSALAAEHGIAVVLEFFPWTSVPDVRTALAVAEAAGPEVGILVDSLHADRSATTTADIRGLPAARLPFAHLADAPVQASYSEADLLHTARAERLPPGQGGIDLEGFVKALPVGLPLAAEVPMTARQRAAGSAAVLAEVAAASRALLRRVDGD